LIGITTKHKHKQHYMQHRDKHVEYVSGYSFITSSLQLISTWCFLTVTVPDFHRIKNSNQYLIFLAKFSIGWYILHLFTFT